MSKTYDQHAQPQKQEATSIVRDILISKAIRRRMIKIYTNTWVRKYDNPNLQKNFHSLASLHKSNKIQYNILTKTKGTSQQQKRELLALLKTA